MNRRLYFLLPDTAHARSVIDELATNGLQREQMHAIAKDSDTLDGLPNTSICQRQDTGRLVGAILWDSNLVIFGLALGAFLSLLILPGLTAWLWLPGLIMGVTFLGGLYFTHVPDIHLTEFRDALDHGKILLMIDVPVAWVSRIENRVHRHHPEAMDGGISWGTPDLVYKLLF